MNSENVIFASSSASAFSAPARYTVYTTTITYGWAFGLPIYSETEITSQIRPRTRPRQLATSTNSESFTSVESSSVQTNTDSTSQSTQPKSNTQSITNGAGTLAGQNAAQSTSQHHSSGISGGAIAAAVIVPIIAVAALIAGILFFLRRRKQRSAKQALINTAYENNDGRAQEMAMPETNGPPVGSGPPTLNHIVPGVLAKETGSPETPTSRQFSGPSAVARKPVLGASQNILPSISTSNEHTSSRDPFATPTPGSTAHNTPEDGPNFLANAANDSTPSRVIPGPYRHDESFMAQPDSGAVGRHWHSVNGTSRFGGRDPRQTYENETRPTSAEDDFSDLSSEEGDVEIGQATVALGQGQRASVIDMHQIGYNGSPPRASTSSGQRQ